MIDNGHVETRKLPNDLPKNASVIIKKLESIVSGKRNGIEKESKEKEDPENSML